MIFTVVICITIENWAISNSNFQCVWDNVGNFIHIIDSIIYLESHTKHYYDILYIS